MSDIKNKHFPTVKEFFESCDCQQISEFLYNFINSNNNTNTKNLILDNYCISSKIDKQLLIEELTLFLNQLVSEIKADVDFNENQKNIESTIVSFGIKINYLKDLSCLLIEMLTSLRKKNLSSNLISYDWQLAIIEGENEKTSTNLNKLDKVELGIQFKRFDNKTEEYKNDVIKFGYNEFFEIFQKLKKIDGQLHLFKN